VNTSQRLQNMSYQNQIPIEDQLADELDRVKRMVDRLVAERIEIAQILARFAAEPISISAIQPLLELNDRLNPRLR